MLGNRIHYAYIVYAHAVAKYLFNLSVHSLWIIIVSFAFYPGTNWNCNHFPVLFVKLEPGNYCWILILISTVYLICGGKQLEDLLLSHELKLCTIINYRHKMIQCIIKCWMFHTLVTNQLIIIVEQSCPTKNGLRNWPIWMMIHSTGHSYELICDAYNSTIHPSIRLNEMQTKILLQKGK